MLTWSTCGEHKLHSGKIKTFGRGKQTIMRVVLLKHDDAKWVFMMSNSMAMCCPVQGVYADKSGPLQILLASCIRFKGCFFRTTQMLVSA
jgi:hypothetical protein